MGLVDPRGTDLGLVVVARFHSQLPPDAAYCQGLRVGLRDLWEAITAELCNPSIMELNLIGSLQKRTFSYY